MAKEIFSKHLSETDILARLSIPTHALQHFERFEGQDVVVKDWTDQQWVFYFSTRDKGHKRPVFTGKWLTFVRAKGLEPDDLLIFSKLEDGEFRIEVLRESDRMLFGQPIMWVAVDKA